VRVEPDTVMAQLRDAGFEGVQAHELLPYHYVISSLKPIS
jgi:hypothetical protein